jgi:hypothetical protein
VPGPPQPLGVDQGSCEAAERLSAADNPRADPYVPPDYVSEPIPNGSLPASGDNGQSRNDSRDEADAAVSKRILATATTTASQLTPRLVNPVLKKGLTFLYHHGSDSGQAER